MYLQNEAFKNTRVPTKHGTYTEQVVACVRGKHNDVGHMAIYNLTLLNLSLDHLCYKHRVNWWVPYM